MKKAAPADLQRWSEELAHNPRSLAFLPLARAYRRLGRRDEALRMCIRGLEQHPTHVEAHALLALLYLEAGDRARAADEWATVLRLKPGNFEALRGMGFAYLEQNNLSKARQHLERAALIRPDDGAVQEALRVLRRRQREQLEREEAARAATPHSAPATAPIPAAPAARERPSPNDPSRLFDGILATGPVLGVLLLDARGLVLAGRFRDGELDRAERVGAMLGGAGDEAERAVSHLSLGSWRGLLLESGNALLQLAPAGDGNVLVIAAERAAPKGWLLRMAEQASALARRHMEVTT